MSLIFEDQKAFFAAEGYLVIKNLLTTEQVTYYSDLYNSFLNNNIDASKYRSNLSGSPGKKEKITQIMVQNKLVSELFQKPIPSKAMIELERAQGVAHTGQREVKN